jgi:PAS domain S-box-containing protein/diguanylate cyclase (GGDEF)-like protein
MLDASPNSSVIDNLKFHTHIQDEVEEVAGVGSWEFKLATKQLSWSKETYKLHGLTFEQNITSEQAFAFYCVDSREILDIHFKNILQHSIPYDLELKLKDSHGDIKWIQITAKIRQENKIITHVYGAIKDITQKRHLASADVDNTAYLASLINNLNDAILTIDEVGVILSANDTVEKTFQYKPAELINKNISILMPEPYRTMHQKYLSAYLKTGKAKIIGIGRELPAIRRDETQFPMELSLSEVTRNGKRIFIGIIRDISERKNAASQIYQLAYYDQVTQLPNRQLFEKELLKLISKSNMTDSYMYIAMIDIDRFSQINLTFGKAAGDYVLSVIAQRINAILPEHIKLYRNTADAFFLLNLSPILKLPLQNSDSFEQLQLQIQQTLADELVINEQYYSLTASIASVLVDSVDSVHLSSPKLISLLEHAISDIKQQGGNKAQIVGENELIGFNRKADIESAMNLGINHQEFYIQLQPQFNAHQQIVASEVLLRWHSQKFGQVGPDEFIPIAEDSALILQLGQFVIKQACKTIAEQKVLGNTCRLSVNISAKQLAQTTFCADLINVVNEWQIEPLQLTLEITETTLISDIELVKKRMHELANVGFLFSIDDFGTGYSSLSYLKELPINEIKIDRYFINEIISSVKNVPIVNAVIQIAQALNVTTVAEGIETKEQFDYLITKGCNLIQGYYLSKPLDMDDWLVLQDPVVLTEST